jgi:hypothetical protein
MVHTPAMHKTTVYLTEEEVEGLRRMAAASGKSRAELIRAGVQLILQQSPLRTFHSMGKDHVTELPRERARSVGAQ